MTTEANELTGSRRWGGLLRQRGFRLLWFGETTSKLGSSVSSIALPMVALTALDANAFQVSVLAATTWLPWLLFGLPAGAWVDRLSSRRVMLSCNAVSFVSFAGVPLAAWSGLLTLWILIIAALLAGTAAVFFETAYQVFLSSLLRPEELTEGNAKLQGSAAAAGIAGPGVGGILVEALGAVYALLADALSFLVSASCLLAIGERAEPSDRTGRRTGLRREITDGLRFVARDAYLRTFTVYGATANLALNAYQALLVVFMVRDLGIGPGTVGALMAGISLGGVLGAASASWVARRFGSARGLLLSQLCAPLALLIPLAGPGGGAALVVAGGLPVAMSWMIVAVSKGSFRQEYCPRHILGRATVSMQFLNYGAIPIGAVLGGSMSEILGIRTTILIATSLFALCGLILVFSPLRRHRELPTAIAVD